MMKVFKSLKADLHVRNRQTCGGAVRVSECAVSAASAPRSKRGASASPAQRSLMPEKHRPVGPGGRANTLHARA